MISWFREDEEEYLVPAFNPDEIKQYLIDKLESYEVGKEYFNEALYKELHEEFPNDLENISGNKVTT